MRYFLLQPNDVLVHLPDCRIEIGQRDTVQINQIGGSPVFMPGRKRPDICIFTKPSHAQVGGSCQVVEASGTVHSLRVTTTEIGAHQYMVLGVVEDSEDMSSNDDAMSLIRRATVS